MELSSKSKAMRDELKEIIEDCEELEVPVCDELSKCINKIEGRLNGTNSNWYHRKIKESN